MTSMTDGLIWPIESMTGAAAEFARIMSGVLESPDNFLFMSYLTMLGHLACTRIRLESELSISPRLYTVLLGESADARKSTAITKTIDFFTDTLPPGTLNMILGVGSAEGLARAFSSGRPGVILIIDELKALIQKMRIESSVLLPCICTLFDSTRFHSLTKSHAIRIDDGQLSLLAASTLDSYQHMFTQQFTDIGFNNRLFVVLGDSKRLFPIPRKVIPPQYLALQRRLKDILAFMDYLNKANGTPYHMPMTREAEDIFARWYHGHEKSLFAKRVDSCGHRLMPLLALNSLQETVNAHIAQQTVDLLNYQIDARRQADPIDADSKVAKLEESVRRVLDRASLTKGQLAQRCHRARAGVWVWNMAIKNLVDSGEVEYDKVSKVFRRIR